MSIDIKHRHADHLIIIEGKTFKANEAGMWSLTEIWQTLNLPKGKQPGKFADRKEAQRLLETGKIGSERKGSQNRTTANKQAMIRYAAWVSAEFEDLVYSAFEAILEMPEVALLIAEHMHTLGQVKSAEILQRIVESDKEARGATLKMINRGRKPRKLSAYELRVQKLSRHVAYVEKKYRGDL